MSPRGCGLASCLRNHAPMQTTRLGLLTVSQIWLGCNSVGSHERQLTHGGVIALLKFHVKVTDQLVKEPPSPVPTDSAPSPARTTPQASSPYAPATANHWAGPGRMSWWLARPPRRGESPGVPGLPLLGDRVRRVAFGGTLDAMSSRCWPRSDFRQCGRLRLCRRSRGGASLA